jgi:hypothetical protein
VLLGNRETTRIPQPAAITPARLTRWAFGRAAAGGGPTVGLRPPFGPPPAPLSHPDCRARRILIVAPQPTPNAIEVAAHRLRKRLLELGATTRIQTLRGIGYVLEDDGA